MIEGRRIAIAVLMALAFSGAVHADMMPLSQSNGDVPCPASQTPESSQQDIPAFNLSVSLSVGLTFGCLSTRRVIVEQAGATPQPVRTLAGDGGSVDLCLYALIGLGLCRSGQLARRSALGWVPDWYHSGGPHQIGHSHAVGPETVCPAPLYCFIQPDVGSDHSTSPCLLGAFTSLRHASQHTPPSFVSRGPPLS